MTSFSHGYPFDPAYGYKLEALLAVVAPQPCVDFAAFWSARYRRVLDHRAAAELRPAGWGCQRFDVHDLSYKSTGG
ncbi:MAG: deacetylase, partial [Gammaproteobacteria bacterium]|nr:deacetylase [Gammaproteobacteria bacterium]